MPVQDGLKAVEKTLGSAKETVSNLLQGRKRNRNKGRNKSPKTVAKDDADKSTRKNTNQVPTVTTVNSNSSEEDDKPPRSSTKRTEAPPRKVRSPPKNKNVKFIPGTKEGPKTILKTETKGQNEGPQSTSQDSPPSQSHAFQQGMTFDVQSPVQTPEDLATTMTQPRDPQGPSTAMGYRPHRPSCSFY